MDQIDIQIIKLLYMDARTPFQRIAKTLGIGTDTVIRRYQGLKERGIITGSSIMLSSRACGFEGLLGIYIKTNPGVSVSIVKSKLAKLPQLCAIWQFLGDYDFYVETHFYSFEETNDLISNLRKIKEIATVDPMFYTGKDWPIPVQLFGPEPPPDWAFGIQDGSYNE